MSDLETLESLKADRDALKERVTYFEDVFERHKAREKYMAEIVFQHIKHGDEKHQEWLRKELVEVLCKENTKACQTFDDLKQQVADLTRKLAEVEKEKSKWAELCSSFTTSQHQYLRDMEALKVKLAASEQARRKLEDDIQAFLS